MRKKTNQKRKRKGNRIPKTIEEKLFDLDAHLFLLREDLQGLKGNAIYLKDISTRLRALICSSSGTEGLLWRLSDELGVDDKIFLHAPGKLNPDRALSLGLQFAVVPICRGGKGDPQLTPKHHSLKYIINECESVVVLGKPLKHEYLIKIIAQQMGTAHEDDGLEPALVSLKSIFINGIEPFVPVLATDAELTLEIGERILEYAEKERGFKRKHHKHNYGDISMLLRLRSKQPLAGRFVLLVFNSYVSDVNIICSASPSGIIFTFKKHGKPVGELLSAYPNDWKSGNDAVFVLSYCSRALQVRTITNGVAHETIKLFDAGWIHASDLYLENLDKDHIDFVEKEYVLTFNRLLSPEDSKGFHESSNACGIWSFSDESEEQGVFP